MIICQKCNKECEVITIDYEEKHEVHGSYVWVLVEVVNKIILANGEGIIQQQPDPGASVCKG